MAIKKIPVHSENADALAAEIYMMRTMNHKCIMQLKDCIFYNDKVWVCPLIENLRPADNISLRWSTWKVDLWQISSLSIKIFPLQKHRYGGLCGMYDFNQVVAYRSEDVLMI